MEADAYVRREPVMASVLIERPLNGDSAVYGELPVVGSITFPPLRETPLAFDRSEETTEKVR